MASNPMQRKARNSFLLGMLIATIILGCVIGILIFQMQKKKKEEESIENAKIFVYALSQDVKAGANVKLTDDEGIPMTKLIEVKVSEAPATAIHKQVEGVLLDEFYSKVDENTLYKIDLKAGTILTEEMFIQSEDITEHDTREQEYNMVILPTYLAKDDYVDIRLRLPSGEDYLVVSKKKVVDTDDETIWMNMSEEEILTLSNAIVEAYQIIGSELYATTYIEPGIQNTATVTYVPSTSVAQLINADPNVVQKAKEELAARYSIATLYKGRTEIINSAIAAGAEDAQENVSTGITTSVEKQKQSRTEYLQELEAAASANTTTTTTTTTTTK